MRQTPHRHIMAILALTFTLLDPTPNALAAPTKLFGYKELSSSHLQSFKKWLNMLEHYNNTQDSITPGEHCAPDNPSKCKWDEWNQFLHSIKHESRREKVQHVNQFINQYSYIIDPINWGMKDYWATPLEFNRKNGDCEDYAIAKYLSLKALGIPKEDMRIVILEDDNLELLHAVLAVYHPNGDVDILDNQIPQTMPHQAIHHYRPIYSINESFWWRHYK